MSTNNDPESSQTPDYAKDDAIPYLEGPYYEYPPALPPSQPQGPVPPTAWAGQRFPQAVPGAVPPVIFPPPTKQRWTRKRLALVITCALLLIALIAGGSYAFSLLGKSAERNQAAYKQGSCPFAPGIGIVEGQDVSCGYLTVPENHSTPQGRTIQLAVAIFKAPHVTSKPAPVLYLSGGPGGGTLGDLGKYITAQNVESITLGRDLILLDQRGTGYSKPALTCPEMTQLDTQMQNMQMSDEKQIIKYGDTAQTCRDHLSSKAIDLNSYTTIENATDVHDLIHALGYQQINLYGVSYGTRLALTTMRLFPQDVRSVVLDSTVPTQINLFKNISSGTQHAYDTLFGGCGANSSCVKEHPQLQETFYKLVTDLNSAPVRLNDPTHGPFLLTGDSFANWLFTALYVSQLIPLLPDIISEVSQGNYTRLIALYGPLMMESNISQALYYSVECGEDMAFTNLPELEQSTRVMRSELRGFMLLSLHSTYAICQSWKQPRVPAEQKQAVKSNLPTLILSGEYDPITPLSNAQLAAKTLSNSHVLSFPATGHGVFLTNICPNQIMQSFWDAPTAAVQDACLARMTEPQFQ